MLKFIKKKKLFKNRRIGTSKLLFLRSRLLRLWSIKPAYKLLFSFKKTDRYFLKRNTWTYRKFLRRSGKKFFYYFLKKVGVYKHIYFLSKYFNHYKRYWDFKLAKKILKLRRSKSTLPPHIKYAKAHRFIFKNDQYCNKYNSKKRLSTLNLVKALAHKKSFSLISDYHRYYKRSAGDPVLYSLRKNNVRYFIKRSELSCYRVLKYLVLFSKFGNRRKLFSSFASSCLSNRFNLFKHFSVSDYFGMFSDGAMLLKGSYYTNTKYLLSLSLFCRRTLFNQFFFYKKNVNSRVRVKLPRLSNSNFFLLSNRLLNHFLRLFRIFVEIKPWKKSGRAISVPVPIKSNARRSFIFAHWFKESVLAVARGSNIGTKVFSEFQSVLGLDGDSIKKLSHLSKSIQSNRALIRKSNLSIV